MLLKCNDDSTFYLKISIKLLILVLIFNYNFALLNVEKHPNTKTLKTREIFRFNTILFHKFFYYVC